MKCLAWRYKELFSACGYALSHLGSGYNYFLCNELFHYHCGRESIPVIPQSNGSRSKQ